MNRRKFLRNVAATGTVSFAGSASILSSLGNAHASQAAGYKAIVCLFFLGGQDCHDTILPYDKNSYDSYVKYRAGILSEYAARPGGSTRDRKRLLELNPVNAADFEGRKFALPETLAPLKSLFDEGNAAIVGNVGPLIEPLSAEDFRGGLRPQPKSLFSHNDQQSTWMASQPEGVIKGWGGKMADALLATNPKQQNIFTGISTAGNSVFLAGDKVKSYVLNTTGPQQVDGLKNHDNYLFRSKVDPEVVSLLEAHYRDAGISRENLLQKDYASITNNAFSANETYARALLKTQKLKTVFPSSDVGQQLKAIAGAINLRDSLNMKQQVFYVGMGGFDTHADQAGALVKLQEAYSEAVAAFYAATVEMGLSKDVTLFTASDFGRALIENGNGTDHGWGGHHFVVGGDVNGNRIYGNIPPCKIGHDYDAGNGRLIPQYSVEQYAGTIGQWLGLNERELLNALPALANFKQRNIGFMG